MKNFNTLRAKRSPEARERSRRLAAKYRAEMALDELRQAREMTQQHLAKLLGVNQAAISKMERRTDMYVSTLSDFIQAMGGELEVIARFPEGSVRIGQFHTLRSNSREKAGSKGDAAAD